MALLLAAGLLWATGLAAQFPCPPPSGRPVDSAGWLACHVDRQPVLIGELAVPRVPPAPVAAGINGTVSYRVMVDSAGRAELGTFTVLTASHPAFVPGVRDALAQWQWAPATNRGHRVSWWFRGVVDFAAPPPTVGWTSAIPPDLLGQRSDPDSGTVVLVGWPARDPAVGSPAPDVDRDVRILALRELVAGLAAGYAGKEVPIACVSFRDRADGLGSRHTVAPDADALAALVQPGVAVVVPARCPPTFASMVRVEGRVIPPGGDPYQVWVGPPQPWTKGTFLVDGGSARGPGGTDFKCWVDVRRVRPVVRCAASGNWVS
ncbi:MAG TPA: energy transducer TonB [Gemmatimonadales bacterium]|nr:energy transducer TonB [Gemmatimonadales bacterium]